MKIFESIAIHGMELKNRIVMAPMQLNLGFRSPRCRAFYAERARGGAGAIIMPATSVDQFVSDEAWGRLGYVARFLEGTRLLVNDVHDAGAKVGVQLWHGNRFPSGIGMYDTRGEQVAPSAREEMRELTTKEIEAIIAKFATAALRAKEAGFDFVEFHGAHHYLPCQFFSPAFNRRSDKYGGSLAGRMGFGIECIMAMREAVGADYPLFFRLGAWEDSTDGIKIEEAAEFAVELEKASVDVIDVSVGSLVRPGILATPGPDQPMGTFAHLADSIKRRLRVPVIAVGRINTPETAEAILSQGKADLVAMGRQLIADPFWPQKAATGKWDEIAPCLSCNTCMDRALAMEELRCSVNASAGRELEYPVSPAEKVKKVLVVGGGPAGMEAARVAAMRGHEVTLCEKTDRLGGQLLAAGLPPHKQEIGRLTRYLAGQLEKAGVRVKLRSEVTVESIEESRPEVVVVATGATPVIPDIPGVEGSNVVTALEILIGDKQVGERVVVIGGELVGCETASYLAERGKKVTITRRGPRMAARLPPLARESLLHRLAEQGVSMLTGVKYEGITERGLVIINKEGQRETIQADSIVLAAGASPNAELARELEGKAEALYLIGDCVEPRRILDAIDDGARVGEKL